MLEKIIAPIAPHHCLVCSRVGNVLCELCQTAELETVPSRCYRCHGATPQFQVCRKCRAASPLRNVWVRTSYDGIGKEIIDKLKFERCSAAATDIAITLTAIVPLVPKDTLVCFIPTASKRIRVRGYDQSRLISQAFAHSRKLELQPLLIRVTSSRQVGAGRKERFSQADSAYRFDEKYSVQDKTILIIDDVTTSGATIEAAAKLLNAQGAQTIYAAVFAQAVD